MYIQPYFPEPLTVTGNAAETPHRIRVRFQKLVCVTHFLAVSVAMVWAAFAPVLPLAQSALALLALLVLLSLHRRFSKGGRTEAAVDALLLVPTIAFAGFVTAALTRAGWPVWALLLGTACAAAYAVLCGNDYSFVGQFALSWLASGIAVLCAAIVRGTGWFEAWVSFAVVTLWLFFLVYDLSMIVKRRRPGQVIEGAADLFRDLLNFATYSVRVYLHWRKFWFI